MLEFSLRLTLFNAFDLIVAMKEEDAEIRESRLVRAGARLVARGADEARQSHVHPNRQGSNSPKSQSLGQLWHQWDSTHVYP